MIWHGLKILRYGYTFFHRKHDCTPASKLRGWLMKKWLAGLKLKRCLSVCPSTIKLTLQHLYQSTCTCCSFVPISLASASCFFYFIFLHVLFEWKKAKSAIVILLCTRFSDTVTLQLIRYPCTAVVGIKIKRHTHWREYMAISSRLLLWYKTIIHFQPHTTTTTIGQQFGSYSTSQFSTSCSMF